ncbi:protein of unknown function [Actinomadura meyerae]|uniref:DUF4350 domain-containing protein n=1 Tax=Actinomadura meyerae TaxID=240840 RepID=A0A239I6G8_9ACTN|nr:DUF4350 domain-containing protein [Actinomadura meyerae]SNS89091.1 protein of unknown function [Actinomadura meyerae]
MVTQAPPGAPAAGPGASGPAGGGGPAEPTARQVAGRRWRSARGVVAVLLALIVIAVVLAALRPSTSADALDPESPRRDGARALAEILRQHGTDVTVARDYEDAFTATAVGGTLVVTHSERLTDDDLRLLTGSQLDLLLVRPTAEALDVLAPQVRRVGPSYAETAAPGCPLPVASLAGKVAFHESDTYEINGPGTACYPAEYGGARVVQVQENAHTVTVLGSASPLTNQRLTEEGNAALAMNLAGAGSSTVWLYPDMPEPGEAAGRQSLGDLLPFGVKLFFLQILVAVLLVALWRGRRLGPVVAEALPVVVRSAETVEGRARLYRAGRARDRASDALRSGARERLVPLLGLPRGSAQDPSAAQEIITAVARRTPYDETYVGAALYGPEPLDDAGLIALTDVLDDLERQVRQS